MGKYIKCPRCELNYIQEEHEYCDVCKAELQGLIIIDDDEELLCPICKQNYVEIGETMCAYCAAKGSADEEIQLEDSIVQRDDNLVSFNELEEKELNDDYEPFDDDDDSFVTDGDLLSDFDEEVLEEEEDEKFDDSDDDDDFEYIDPDDVDFDDDDEDYEELEDSEA